MSMQSVNSAFTRIYDSTYDQVLCFIASRCEKASDISDLVQNTYLLFYERLQKKGEGYFQEPLRYLYKIARGELYQYYGHLSTWRRSVAVFSHEEGITAEEERRWLTDDSLQDKLDADELWETISRMEETTVQILTLYLLGGQKLVEIAKGLGRSESFVKNRLYRAIRTLREEFSE